VHHGISPAENGVPCNTSAPVYSWPLNRQLVRAWSITRWNKLKFHYRSLFLPEKWNIALMHQPAEDILISGLKSRTQWLKEAPPGEYYADPFCLDAGKKELVFEHYRYKTNKGDLSVCVDNEIKPFLAFGYHLSYPFVAQTPHGKKILPECFNSGDWLAFNAAIPSEAPQIVLENFPAVDATPFEWQGKWWMLCTRAGEMSNTELHAFYADSVEGPWQPHSNNPVKCDIRSSRPGGTPFYSDGKLIRPAQDCSTTYGAAILLQEIIRLDEFSFEEKTVRRLDPHSSWKYNRGLHTFSVIDAQTVAIDAKVFAFNFDNFGHALRRKLRRLFRQ
jgi:hypothetical protein